MAGISHIFNFDLPRVPEDYVHRIGRTGRAGAKGVAIALAYPKERWQVKQIESYTGQPIKLSVKEGFEAPTFAKPQKFAGRGAEKSGDRSRGAGRAGGNRNSAPQRNDRRGESSKRPAR